LCQQGCAHLPLRFSFVLEYTIRKVQENQEESELNGTCQLMAYADVTLSDKNVNASKEVCLEVNTGKN
jgi:hypothetical protein